VHLEVTAARNRYSSSTSERSAALKASNSVLMASQILDTVDLETLACLPKASSSAASTSRVDRPRM
jgi:hypothetical protein